MTQTGSGFGNGSSWANAYSAEKFMDVLFTNYGLFSESSTVHMGAGTYSPLLSDDGSFVCQIMLNKQVTFIGGYPANGGSETSPKNITIFTGDCDGDAVADANCLFELEGSKKYIFSGITFKNNKAGSESALLKIKNASVEIDSCFFESSNGCAIRLSDQRSSVKVMNSTFNSGVTDSPCYIFSYPLGTFEINSCYIHSNYNLGNFYSSQESTPSIAATRFKGSVINSSFLGNINHNFYGECSLNYYHNTFSGGSFSVSAYNDSKTKLSLVGNIISMSSSVNIDNNISQSNILYGTIVNVDRANVTNNTICDVSKLLQLKSLSYAKMWVLLDDHYTDDKGIVTTFRVPRLDEVGVDQVGTRRKRQTCAGACEINSIPINTHYYVKVDGAGDGDGSSWEDAMSAKDFFARFNASLNNDTFYLAEGVYRTKLFNSNLTGVSRTKHVCLIGGFRKDILEEDEAPDPNTYHTVFSEDYMNDDKVVLGVLDISFENRSDNGNSIFTLNPSTESGTSVFSGIEFEGTGSSTGAIKLKTPGVSDPGKMIFRNCTFSNQDVCFGIDSGLYGVEIDNCRFTNIKKIGTIFNILVKNSSFNHIEYGMLIPLKNGRIENSTCVDVKRYFVDAKSNIYLHNNTIIASNDSCFVGVYSGSELAGNIMYVKTVKNQGTEPVVSSYNVYSNANDFMSNTDFVATTEHFGEFLNGSVNYNGYFVPDVTTIDNFTSVVPLVTDTLPGTFSFRMPRINTVLTDQRGVARPELTCIGAYEYERHFDYAKVPIPTSFTPFDFNGKNDVFMSGYEVFIYNRQGKLVAHAEDGWDGSNSEGELVYPGLYIYAVRFPDGLVRRGTVEVVKY